ncbi:helix-turn-helix domain-containing protein [Streptosporangium sandarakinum]|uniref:helix-turn-helix domain-containing protein n=1 Tax=Streptosporangium sandarakinum TaxID=1260955 RepID=UPI003718904B
MQHPVALEEGRARLSVVPDSLLLDLLRRREALGLKPEYVAERMGITRQGVYELERKIRNGENILFSTAINYAHAVGALLFAEEDPDFTPPPPPALPNCKNEACGDPIPKGTGRNGLCGACYNRWHKAGRPEQVPPRSGRTPGQAMAEQRQALAAIRRAEARRRFTVLNQDVETIAKALKVTVPTVKGYLADLLAPDNAAPTAI